MLSDSDIAQLLPRVWDPFVGRFGRLTEVQRQAIPPILAGADVLVSSPTATGKTEAVCAPLIEQRLSRADPWRILYVSPTRALVNDLAGRLTSPLGQLGVRMARRTGEHKDGMSGPAVVVLTTPESFDSLLCRGRRPDGEHLLFHVDGVVLDEVHLLFGGARGEQVRWLIERLRRVRSFGAETGKTASSGLQVVALSATVPEPLAIANTFLRDGAVITVGGGRTIEAVAPGVTLPTPEEAVPAYLGGRVPGEKLLVFSNARRRVDDLSATLGASLQSLGYRVYAHHGSLSKAVREEAEGAARDLDKVVICATSTLEIGIDIGNIDLVVLDGPAPNLSALLQRIGRGNRRTGETRVMACAGSAAEAIGQAAMIEAVRAGQIGGLEHGPEYAVAIQQLASYVFQSPSGTRPLPVLESLVRSLLPALDADALLRHLIAQGDLDLSGGGVGLGARWLEATSRGEIHSTIEAAMGFSVEDDATGDKIAHGVRSHKGPGLRMAGRLLEVRGWDEFRIRVRSTEQQASATGEWSYVSSRWLFGRGQPQAVQRYLGLDASEWPVLTRSTGIVAFHFGGGRRQAVLGLAMRAAGGPPGQITGWTLALPQGHAVKPRWLTGLSAQVLVSQLLDWETLTRLERALARPRANAGLPEDLRRKEVEEWLHLEDEIHSINEARFVDVNDLDLAGALRALADPIRR